VLAREENPLVRAAVATYEGAVWLPVPDERVRTFLEGVLTRVDRSKSEGRA
jgi:hypothetical protein